jgi:peptidoglycan/xylan/chitin deacetylase (PgdA/CDA1 family)
MNAPGGAGLQGLARTIRRRFARNALILVYHRVAEVGCDPFSLCVSPARFEEQLDVFHRIARPLRLRNLARALHAGTVPRRAVALTFDDGYSDNLETAKPLLERFDIPATMFIASGQLEEAREFWWDELERVFLEPIALPPVLRLAVGGTVREWNFGEEAARGGDGLARHPGWRAWEDAPTERHAAYFGLWKLLRPLCEAERRLLLDEIVSWAQVGFERRAAYRTLAADGVRDLAAGELIEIGAHTVTHPALCEHPGRFQRAEIRQSRATLEEILGREVASFAYPYGARSGETVEIVRACGFACACTTEPESVAPGADRFELPRMQVEDWDGDEFSKRLEAWFDGEEVHPQ